MIRAALFAVGALAFWPATASADPCTARVPTQAGAEFGGVVTYVGDGDSLCVGAAGSDPSTWIEVRLMDFNSPEMREPGGPQARDTLRRLVMGRPARCVVTRSTQSGRTRSFDRTHAICLVNGQRVGDLMRGAGIAEGGN